MPSKSKSQQRFFGLVHKCKKTGKCLGAKIKKAADTISQEDAEDFASTKHKGLPNKIRKRKRKTFKEYLEIEHPEFNYEENIIGAVIAMARAAKNKGRNRVSYNQENYDEISEKNEYYLWTNKEGTEQKKGLFIKRENNFIYIKSKEGITNKFHTNWFSEKDLKYVGAIEELNRIAADLQLLKNKINTTEDKIAKEDLLNKYKQSEAAYKQAKVKVESFNN
jgi:hypothetical protein